MKYSKAVEIMMQLKAEYFYAFKDIPDELFKVKVKNFMNALEGYTDKEIDVALGFILKENKTVPTTANFIEVLERNREFLLPSCEEEWNSVVCAITKVKLSRDMDIDIRKKTMDEAYASLSKDVREYYVSLTGFIALLDIKNLEITKAQFLKAFPEWRRQKLKKENLLKKIGEEPNGT